MIVTEFFNFVHSVTLLISRNENKKCNCKNTTVLHMLDKMLYGHINGAFSRFSQGRNFLKGDL